MVSCFISRIVILVFGTLYPAYASYKAVRTKNVKEYVKWMMYWIVFALFTSIETFTDLFISFWFPFYYELKIITVIYLLSPATNGSSILYRKFVHPVLTQREQEIDEYITKAKEQGYHTMLNLGSKGVTYATSLIMQTAIKGGGGLLGHLKKSYSLGDLSEDSSMTQKRDFRDEVDHRRYEDPRMMRRGISDTNDQSLYFPEVDTYNRRLPPMTDEEYYRQFPSLEEASSGYSSGDTIYHREPLMRTASIGESGRIRTRASVRNLPKRGSLSEGGPTWSPVEINHSQRESDERFFIPLTHSSSLPVSFTAINHLVKPEYQQVFDGLSQGQLLALINSSKLASPGSDSGPGSVAEPRVSLIVSEVTDAEIDERKTESETVSPEMQSSVEEQTPVKEEKTVEVEEETSKGIGKVEKSGKFNKRQAPSPPVKVTERTEHDDEEFVTPNSSPKLNRKASSSYTNLVEEIIDGSKKTDEKLRKTLEVPKKSSKSKKTKKLHLPKMSFSFWNQKTGKHSSESENSSIASSENLAAGITASDKTATDKKNDCFYIPLKGESEVENRTTDDKL